MNLEKQKVHDFWNEAACGENLYLGTNDMNGYSKQAKSRYELEGEMIFGLARFNETRGQKVLEIGVGLGADHQKFAEAGADLFGLDLTARAIEHTRQRMKVFGLKSNLCVGDAESMDFRDGEFDTVYSWPIFVKAKQQPF